MFSRKKWFGIVLMMFFTGFMVIGCLTLSRPYGPSDFDPELNGIWVLNGHTSEVLLILSNSHSAWETSGDVYLGSLSVRNPSTVGRCPRGVYLPRDGVIKFQTTNIIFDVVNWYDNLPDGPRDLHRTEFPLMDGVTDNEYWDFELKYTIVGDQLTFTRKEGSTFSFTRRSNVPELTRTQWRARGR